MSEQQTAELLARRWAALGAMFNVAPDPGMPDLERLLLDTARNSAVAPAPYFLAVSWLAAYGSMVARHRLRRLIATDLENEHQAALGLMLESAIALEPKMRPHFRAALRACRRAETPGPLAAIDSRNAALRRLSEQSASTISKRWGRWCEPIAFKSDVLRPPEWLASRHPALASRALLGGDVAASILAEAGEMLSFASEVDLAHRCGASRPAVREALAKLRLAGLATWKAVGRRNEIRIRNITP